jgi:hypothetical protein
MVRAGQLGGAAKNLIGPDKIDFIDSIKNKDADFHAALLSNSAVGVSLNITAWLHRPVFSQHIPSERRPAFASREAARVGGRA